VRAREVFWVRPVEKGVSLVDFEHMAALVSDVVKEETGRLRLKAMLGGQLIVSLLACSWSRRKRSFWNPMARACLHGIGHVIQVRLECQPEEVGWSGPNFASSLRTTPGIPLGSRLKTTSKSSW